MAIAAGRDDTLPMLTGVRLEIDGVAHPGGNRPVPAGGARVQWEPGQVGQSRPTARPPDPRPADPHRCRQEPDSRGLNIALALGPGEGSSASPAAAGGPPPGCWTPSSRYRKLLPSEFSSAEVAAPLTEAVKRVALVAERGNPVRLQFEEGSLTAGGDDEGGPRRTWRPFAGEP